MQKPKFIQRLFFLLILAMSLPACGGANQSSSSESIAVSGAFALYPMMVRWGEEYQKLHPEVRIDITAGGAGKGMADTLAGVVNIGMVSREVKDEEKEKGAFAIAVTKDAVFGVVSAKNPHLDRIMQRGISKEAYTKIFLTGEYKTWGDVLGDPAITDELHAYTRSDACGAAEMWAKFIGGKAQEELKGVGVNSDPGELEAVIKDPLGIGYNNLNYVFDASTNKAVEGSLAAPLDINGDGAVQEDERYDTRQQAMQAVASGKYPAPPARPLYLVTKGQPSGSTADLIKWILNDGQKYVPESGYINLTDEQLAAERKKLP